MNAAELRRDFQASDPASRIRRGLQLSHFGSRLSKALLEARPPHLNQQ